MAEFGNRLPARQGAQCRTAWVLTEERSEGGPGAFQISLAGCLTAPG
jgi:hypothetical protein